VKREDSLAIGGTNERDWIPVNLTIWQRGTRGRGLNREKTQRLCFRFYTNRRKPEKKKGKSLYVERRKKEVH